MMRGVERGGGGMQSSRNCCLRRRREGERLKPNGKRKETREWGKVLQGRKEEEAYRRRRSRINGLEMEGRASGGEIGGGRNRRRRCPFAKAPHR